MQGLVSRYRITCGLNGASIRGVTRVEESINISSFTWGQEGIYIGNIKRGHVGVHTGSGTRGEGEGSRQSYKRTGRQ
jgi:hypothetical protein